MRNRWRRNPDPRERELERRWHAGDLEAKWRLNAIALQRGRIPEPDLTATILWGDVPEGSVWRERRTPNPDSIFRQTRNWAFPSGLGLSVNYDDAFPVPGMAYDPETYPRDKWHVEGVIYKMEPGLSPGEEVYKGWRLEGVPLVPNHSFVRHTTRRFLANDQGELLGMLRVAASGDLPPEPDYESMWEDNPDPSERELERRAYEGDVRAAKDLIRVKARSRRPEGIFDLMDLLETEEDMKWAASEYWSARGIHDPHWWYAYYRRQGMDGGYAILAHDSREALEKLREHGVQGHPTHGPLWLDPARVKEFPPSRVLRNPTDDFEEFDYYHGTPEWRLRQIRERGLVYPFLSSDTAQARCWGGHYSTDPRTRRVLGVERLPDPDRLVPDFNLMDPYERQEVLGVHPEEYFDVRSEMGTPEQDARLIEGARKYGQDWTEDRECGGEASIYLGTIPWKDLRLVRPHRGNPPAGDRRARELDRAWRAGDAQAAFRHLALIQRTGGWAASEHPDLFWFLLEVPGGPGAMVEAARGSENPMVEAWETMEVPYTLMRAFRMGYMGRVEVKYHSANKAKWHVAATRPAEWQFNVTSDPLIPLIHLPGHPGYFLASTSGPGVRKSAGKFFKTRGSGHLIHPSRIEWVRIMTPRPGREGRIRWKNNPDPRERELERRAAAGDPQAREALLMHRKRAGQIKWNLEGVLETVRAKPGLTRKEIAFLWGRRKSDGGGLLAQLMRDFLVHDDELGRWWPGPNTKRSWEFAYGCYPPDAISDVASRIPLRASNPRATLRALEGCVDFLSWAARETEGVYDKSRQRRLLSALKKLTELRDEVRRGERWVRSRQARADAVRRTLRSVTELERPDTYHWCPRVCRDCGATESTTGPWFNRLRNLDEFLCHSCAQTSGLA